MVVIGQNMTCFMLLSETTKRLNIWYIMPICGAIHESSRKIPNVSVKIRAEDKENGAERRVPC